MTAAEDIATVRDARPVVADLARAVSLSATIDTAFVRRMRLELLPMSDVSTEADLWTSVLVQGRDEGELELRDDVRAELWKEHANDRPGLALAWNTLKRIRTHERPLVQLEEKLIYHAIVQDSEAIDRELRLVIAAMRDEPARRRNLAAWSARALEFLPPIVRETEAAKILGNVAGSWVATHTAIAGMTPDVDGSILARTLQPDSKRLDVYLRSVGGMLEVGTSVPAEPYVTISDFPAANPKLIVDHDKVHSVDLKGVTRIHVPQGRFMIGTPDRRRWWLEPAQEQPPLESIGTIPAGDDGVAYAMYLVSPIYAVTSARVRASAPILADFGGGLREGDVIAVDEDADIALILLAMYMNEPALELQPEIEQGATWQAFGPGGRVLGTIAAGWPAVTLRPATVNATPLLPGTPIFCDTKVLGHVRTTSPDGLIHMTSARLVRWWLSQVAPAQNIESGSVGAFKPLRPNAQVRAAPTLWVASQQIEAIPPEIGMASPLVTEGDLVVLFVGDKLRWPGAIYRVTDDPPVQIPPPTLPISRTRARIALKLNRPPDEVLRSDQQTILELLNEPAPHPSAGRVNPNDLRVLLMRYAAHVPAEPTVNMEVREEIRMERELRRLIGDSSISDRRTLPVTIELPHQISTDGVLGTVLEQQGGLRRFRKHQWCDHEVAILTEMTTPTDPIGIRVQVREQEMDPRSAQMELAVRLFRNPGKEEFFEACERAARTFAAEVIRGPRRGGTSGEYDLQLVVNRVPGLSPAHAFRRAVQFVVAALDALDYGPELRGVSWLRLPGIGLMDLVEAQDMVRNASTARGVTLTWIDPETDLAEIRFEIDASGNTAMYQAVAQALGRRYESAYERSYWGDPLRGRFGGASERGNRIIGVDASGSDARISVRATDEKPIRGYVAFYSTLGGRIIEQLRVRAIEGVARCERIWREESYAVGAVIEDEGIMLEILVEGPDERSAKKRPS